MRFVPPARPRPASTRPAALPLLALTLLLAIGTPADAQWKWRDKDGQINLSDRPPPKDVADKDILGRPAPATTPRAAPAAAASAPGVVAKASLAGPSTPLERELDARKREAEQEQLERQKTEQAQRTAALAENCRRARSHMAALESGQRIARMNDRGESEVLDDQTRAEETRRTREIIASDCR